MNSRSKRRKRRKKKRIKKLTSHLPGELIRGLCQNKSVYLVLKSKNPTRSIFLE
jgi:hypothetical protein